MAIQFNYTAPTAPAPNAAPTLPGASVQAPTPKGGAVPFNYVPNKPIPAPVAPAAPEAPATPLFSSKGPIPGLPSVDLTKPIVDTVKNTADTYHNAVKDLLDNAGKNDESTSKNPIVRTGENALGATASGINTVFAPITGAVKALSDSIANDPTVQHITQNPVLGKILDVFGAGSDKLNSWAEAHPEAARNLSNLLTVGLTAAGGETKAAEAPVGTVADVKNAVVDAAKSTKEIPGAIKEAIPHPIEAIQNKLSADNATPQLKTSASRIEAPVETYNKFVDMAKQAKTDVKADPPLAKVGEEIGNNFEKVVKMRQGAGKTMGAELEKVGSIKTDTSSALSDFQNKIKEQGIKISNTKTAKGVIPTLTLSNDTASIPKEPTIDFKTGMPEVPKTEGSQVSKNSTLSTNGQTKFTGEDVNILQKYHNDLKGLGKNPTIKDLDAFMSRVPKELDVYKSQNNIIGTTNAERIIKGSLSDLREQLNPKTTGNKALKPYYDARTKYSNLSSFIEDNQSFLGKKTASGDFAKDASLAKSSVQSLLNNGKKDFLVQLEKLTGYKGLDKSIMALQAMKDVGDARGTSLLQTLSEDLPHSASGVTKQIIDYVGGKIKDRIAGTPEEQTRRFLQRLEGDKSIQSQPTTQSKANIPAKGGDNASSIKNNKIPIKLKVSQVENKVNLPGKSLVDKFKDTPNKQGGFIKVPGFSQGASMAEKGTMRDFMDMVAGEYKPKDVQAVKDLKAAAQDIATKYKFKSAFGGDKGLSSAFGKYLNRVKFNK